jgi:radical SAM superfamily enzyme YgiQ (UPF0313 family)
MTARVFLADPRHTYANTLASDSGPLGIGYMKAVMDRDLPEVESRLFVYPERVVEAIREDPPDVFMATNYTWNEHLSLQLAGLAKRANPDTLVVFGGPNIPHEPERQLEFVRRHPEIDIYVQGEGDYLATEMVRRFLEADKSRDGLTAQELPSAIWRRPDGEIVRSEVMGRRRDLNDIPSPWLTGVLDEFFDGRLCPLWETNRGCPFTCTFCAQGTDYYTKVTYFDLERLKEEIQYIGRMIHERSPSIPTLQVADPNYGMYERDVEISGYIGEVQKQYRWPIYINATTGKNRADRIIRSMEKVSGALILYQAVQTLDEDVLRNIKRQNIKLEGYEEILGALKARGMRSSSDLILALPGDTLKSHVASLSRLIDAGINRLQNFQCILLKGTELDRLDSRARFGFETRHRSVQKSFGVYGEEQVIETEEIVVKTDTLSFEQYLTARAYHLSTGIFLNNARLEALFSFAGQFGLKRSEVFHALTDEYLALEEGPVADLRRAFLAETEGELFEDRESAVSFYGTPENFERLAQGEIGDNVLNKYCAVAWLRIWDDVCRLALSVIRRLVVEHGASDLVEDFDGFWADVERYQLSRHASGRTLEQLTAEVHTTLAHDLPRWVEDGSPLDIEPYRLGGSAEAHFALAGKNLEDVEAAVSTWGLEVQGLSVMIRRTSPLMLERGVMLELLGSAER